MSHPIKINIIYWHQLSFFLGHYSLFGILLGRYTN